LRKETQESDTELKIKKRVVIMATLMNRNLEGFLNKAIIMMQIDFQKFYQGPKLIKCPHISTFQA
jgi:hypothetical protein